MIEMSAEVGTLFAALAEFQAECPSPRKNAKNPHFKSKFADLPEVIDTIRPFMHKHGLSYVQMPCDADKGSVGVVTQLQHKSGQWLRARYSLPLPKSDPQGVGTCISYGRRYGLLAALGLAAEDDDGQYASTPAPRREPRTMESIANEGGAAGEQRESPTSRPTPAGQTTTSGSATEPTVSSRHSSEQKQPPSADSSAISDGELLDAKAWRDRYAAVCVEAAEAKCSFLGEDENGIAEPAWPCPVFAKDAKRFGGLRYDDPKCIGFIRKTAQEAGFGEKELVKRLWALRAIAVHETKKEEAGDV